jgi:predicted RNA-binding Zn-ribbon protein involved in translation (DUF1610 family)
LKVYGSTMPRPHHPSRRKRRLAWTLTITSALLAVVWVGSMKVEMSMIVWPEHLLVADRGAVGLQQFVSLDDESGPLFFFQVKHRWQARWWYRDESYDLPFFSGVTWSDTMVWYIPLWPFVLLTGVPGVWMLVKTRKHTNPHACPACGYDRTGLPQTPTGPAPCPECGKG